MASRPRAPIPGPLQSGALHRGDPVSIPGPRRQVLGITGIASGIDSDESKLNLIGRWSGRLDLDEGVPGFVLLDVSGGHEAG